MEAKQMGSAENTEGEKACQIGKFVFLICAASELGGPCQSLFYGPGTDAQKNRRCGHRTGEALTAVVSAVSLDIQLQRAR